MELNIQDLQENKALEQRNNNLYFEMYKFCENYNIAMGYGGDWFNPQTATKDYKVNFYDLEFMKDYTTELSAVIDDEGAKPQLQIRFTDKGIYKLIELGNMEVIQAIQNCFTDIVKDLKDENIIF